MAVALGIMAAVFIMLTQILELIIQIPHDNVLAVINTGENYCLRLVTKSAINLSHKKVN
jgi:hypothetical protein